MWCRISGVKLSRAMQVPGAQSGWVGLMGAEFLSLAPCASHQVDPLPTRHPTQPGVCRERPPARRAGSALGEGPAQGSRRRSRSSRCRRRRVLVVVPGPPLRAFALPFSPPPRHAGRLDDAPPLHSCSLKPPCAVRVVHATCMRGTAVPLPPAQLDFRAPLPLPLPAVQGYDWRLTQAYRNLGPHDKRHVCVWGLASAVAATTADTPVWCSQAVWGERRRVGSRTVTDCRGRHVQFCLAPWALYGQVRMAPAITAWSCWLEGDQANGLESHERPRSS